jgi:monoamine oxidase
MSLTRRQFLTRVGHAGGYGAAFVLMQSLGLLAVPESAAGSTLRIVNGKGTHVVILGAGIAGLVTAYELSKAGWTCTVLEPRQRPGGRNWSIRKGTQVDFTDGTRQVCNFDEGHYFNAGPARLPSLHHTMLGYCQELGVALEVEVNSSRSALMQCDKLNGGAPVEQRRVVNDTRGHVAELLAKCIRKGALDQEIDADDRERMIEFLRQYGDLEPDLLFKGTERSGYKVAPGALPQAPVFIDPLPMHSMLDADLWSRMMSEEVPDWQPTMFQPVGGMDHIPMAFGKKLGNTVRYGCEVKRIRQSDAGVTVSFREAGGQDQTISADYCVCAMPLNIAQTLDADFNQEIRTILDNVQYDSAYKVAWEAPRFWEKEANIFGGISYLQQAVDVVWYPSAELFSERGVLIGGYSLESRSASGKLPNPQEMIALSRRSVELLHQGHGKHLSNPVYISWGRIPHNLGSWIGSVSDGRLQQPDDKILATLQAPDRRVYFAGDHTSHIVGWQEGAALSAHRVITQLGTRIQGA